MSRPEPAAQSFPCLKAKLFLHWALSDPPQWHLTKASMHLSPSQFALLSHVESSNSSAFRNTTRGPQSFASFVWYTKLVQFKDSITDLKRFASSKREMRSDLMPAWRRVPRWWAYLRFNFLLKMTIYGHMLRHRLGVVRACGFITYWRKWNSVLFLRALSALFDLGPALVGLLDSQDVVFCSISSFGFFCGQLSIWATLRGHGVRPAKSRRTAVKTMWWERFV